MDYLSALPADLKTLLQYYINYDNWKLASVIYRECLSFRSEPNNSDHIVYSENRQKLLSNIKLKFLMKKIIDWNMYESYYHVSRPILDVNELITLQTIKNILNEFIANDRYIKCAWNEMNSLLKKHKCPLQIVNVCLKCYPNKKFIKYIVINTEKCTASVVLDDIVKKLSQQ